MLQIKPLSKESIPSALVKAKHYRLLNEPWQAESICRDILNVEPTNQKAILSLILAITDLFSVDDMSSEVEARKLCSELTDEYESKYYQGIIEEKAGKTALKRQIPRAGYIAYEYLRKAMRFYEEAEKIRPNENDDAILRWNACVRRIQEFKLQPSSEEEEVQPFLDV
jgi:hypothetical protein